MDAFLDNFAKLGRYLVAIALIWLGATGLLDIGFTTIAELPVVEVDYVSDIIYALQIIVGIGIFNKSVKRFAKPIALLYFLLLGYSVYLGYEAMFSPAIPYLSDYGRDILLEMILIFSGYSYLRHLK